MRARKRRGALDVLFVLVVVVTLASNAKAQDTDQESTGEGESNPHAGATVGGRGSPDIFQPPEDVEQEDASQPAGTIVVDLHDGDDAPVRGEIVTLGILINSIAKGDTRKHLQQTTDERGRAVFSELETASNIAYRVSAGHEGGAFAALPFQMSQTKAMHVVLHVYPVTRDDAAAMVLFQAAVATELRDDRLQVEEAFTVYNVGRTAWQPDSLRLALPTGYTAFGAQPSMSDQGVDDVNGAAQLHGTFPPGQHSIEFHWQLPLSGESDVDFEVGLPPHVAFARALTPASSRVKLVASDFPPAEVRKDSQGQAFLVTERRVRFGDEPLHSLRIGIHDLPTPGPGRLVAAGLAAVAVAWGLFRALSRSRQDAASESTERADADTVRASLLDEVLTLERARVSGQVGPRTYERARRELMEALAMSFAKAVKS